MELPRGYAWTKGRRFQDQMENDQARNLALLLSVTFVFLLMGVLFESFVLPLSIVTTIPMALVGVYWTLYLTGTPLDVMGGVGLVVLIGVVVNNGIVLVDLVTQLRAEGVERQEALIQAGKRRMRPILMTALTTIFGLLPMALGTESFVGIPYAPLARVVAGGMAAATVLTLFFVPYLYVALDDARALSERVLAYAWPSRS
jgi:HAE1 family hydrophobic/amphiphilic exporter-1